MTPLSAQVPDYTLDEWLGSGFNQRAVPFFKLLALQTSHSRTSYSPPDRRVVVGFSCASGAAFGNSELSFLTGKTGIFPSFEGSVWISSNLRLKGQVTGFTSSGDVLMSASYGFDLLLNSKQAGSPYWLVNFHRGSLEGSDDFFMKTVAAGIFRGINYRDGRLWIGFASDSYGAGVHIYDPEEGSVFRRRVEGDISHLKLGASKRISTSIEIDVEMGIHPSYFSFVIGTHKLIG